MLEKLLKLFSLSKQPKEKTYKTPEEVIVPPIPDPLVEYFDQIMRYCYQRLDQPFEVMEQIYRYMDRYNQFVDTFAVCEKGCSACCSIPVNVTRLEAEYIAKSTHHKIDNQRIAVVGNSVCPFISADGTCSIYEARPFNCRTFHTLDNPKYCETGEPHATYGSAGFGYGVTILESLAELIRRVNRQNGNNDIRVYFLRHSLMNKE